MKIGVETGYPYAQRLVTNRLNAAKNAPSATEASKQAVQDTQRADFTHMTRTQLIHWINDQISSGKMSLDESTSFVSLTVNITEDGRQIAAADERPVNFMQQVRDGIEGARWRNDPERAKRLEWMLGVMQQNQKQATRIDIMA